MRRIGRKWKRSKLTDHDPGTWTPGGCKEEDEDGDERYLCIYGGYVVRDVYSGGDGVGLVKTDGDTNDGNQELANEHTKSAPTARERQRSIISASSI